MYQVQIVKLSLYSTVSTLGHGVHDVLRGWNSDDLVLFHLVTFAFA